VFHALREECEFEGTMFVDCMGKKAETCLYASIFGIPESVSIEVYDEYAEEAKRLVAQECKPNTTIEVILGTFHDYFRFDATIIYFDCTDLVASSDFMDEGAFLTVFFELCSACLPGTHCVVLTYNPIFDPKTDYNAPNMKVVYKSSICMHTTEECFCYICVVLSDMAKLELLSRIL